MSSNKGKIINHKGIQYVREKASAGAMVTWNGCDLNTSFNEVCKYSRECELTGTILKLRKKEEENK